MRLKALPEFKPTAFALGSQIYVFTEKHTCRRQYKQMHQNQKLQNLHIKSDALSNKTNIPKTKT